jgi:hypothetical protein
VNLVHGNSERPDAIDAHALHDVHRHHDHRRPQSQQLLEIESFSITDDRQIRRVSRLGAVRDGPDQAVARASGIQHRRGAGSQRHDAAGRGAHGEQFAGVVADLAHGFARRQRRADEQRQDQEFPHGRGGWGRNPVFAAHPAHPVPADRVIRGFSDRARHEARIGRRAAQESSASRARNLWRAGISFHTLTLSARTTMAATRICCMTVTYAHAAMTR